VSAGGNYACAIRDDNTLWCWGYNRFGALGAGSYRNHLGPVQVGAQAVWAQVSAGTNHVCALRTDGTLWCWGLNDGGDLGIASPFTQQSPVQVGTDTDWRQVSAGGSSTCAIRTDQTLWCWGLNIAGLIGVGSTTRAFRAPTQVRPATGWQQVSVSGPGTLAHACAIDTGSSLWCWGANNAGQLGTGGETGQLSPVEVGIQNDWRQVATGDSFTCATRGDPRLWCWGDNSSGQLGIGSTFGPQNSPVPAGPARLWHQVAAGASHACAIRTDRTLWCWGQNSDGELGIASTVNQDSPVQVGQST
jgi:alpha-tubulin suppressor-like RCC1 family protein